MGQSLMKLAPGSEESKEKEIGSTIEECYDKYFKGNENNENWKIVDFHRAICQTVEDINEKLNSTQFRIPDVEKLDQVYKKHVKNKGQQPLTKEEFQKIMQELILGIRFTGFGSKDIFLFVFGIPAAASLVKQRLPLKVIPNDFFIPGVTSATVFILAKLHKI